MEFATGSSAWRHFLTLSNDLFGPKILVCPADERSEATNFAALRDTHLSYFVNLDATTNYPAMVLAGDRNITNGLRPLEPVLFVSSNQTAEIGVGWTKGLHPLRGNVVLVDGSVQQTSSHALRKTLRDCGVPTNRFAVP